MLAALCVLVVVSFLYFFLRRQAAEKKERKEKEFQNAIYDALSEKSDVVVCIFDRDSRKLEQVSGTVSGSWGGPAKNISPIQSYWKSFAVWRILLYMNGFWREASVRTRYTSFPCSIRPQEKFLSVSP